MQYISVAEAAQKWGVSPRSARNYCAKGQIDGAVLRGKTWLIPFNAQKPHKAEERTLLQVLRAEKDGKISGGIYHQVQIDLTYNSNHIEGSTLTREQTRYIFETNTIGAEGGVKVDDIVETANHFKCVDMAIDEARRPLSEAFIKRLHLTLKSGTTDSRNAWFAVGEYKKLPNSVGGNFTTPPEEVPFEMKKLLSSYNKGGKKSLDELLDFHHSFERIHPFQDGNGRVGRLILFKECLRHDIVPFIISEDIKYYYYRGLSMWEKERRFLRDTCLAAQDKFKTYLQYYRISFN